MILKKLMTIRGLYGVIVTCKCHLIILIKENCVEGYEIMEPL